MLRLFFCFAWVLFIWVLLGLKESHLILGADGIFNLWPIMSRSSDFAFDILGGAQISEVYGRPLICSLLVQLGVSTIWALNWTVLLFQTAMAYLMLATLSQDSAESTVEENVCLSFVCVGLIAFLPAYGWRISRGHLNLVQGIAYLFSILALYQMLRTRQLSLLNCAVVLFVVLNGLPSGAGQLFAYGLVFGLPLFIALFLEDKKSFLRTVGLTITAALIVTPWLFPVVYNALHGQFSHTQNAAGNVYGYITQTWDDWKQCFFWFFPVVPNPREPMFQHEAYLSFGPIPFLALAWYARERRFLQLGLCLGSIFLFMMFASNVSPISDAVLKIFPLLNNFRVPLRSGLIPLLFMQFFGTARLLQTTSRCKGPLHLWSHVLPLTLVGLILLALLPVIAREFVAWALVFAFLHPRATLVPRFIALGAVTLLSGLSIMAYQTTLWPPLTDTAEFQRKIAEARLNLELKAPQLFTPLVRTQVELPGMGPSAAALIGLSTLNGYWFPTTGFASLLAALDGAAGPSPMQMGFYIYRDQRGFDVLRDLYNIQAVDRSGREGKIDIEILPANVSVWSSPQQKQYSSYLDLVQQMQNSDRHAVQWVPTTTINLLQNPDCGMTTFSSITTKGAEFGFDMKSRARCPTTVAINHMSSVRVETQNGERLENYVADGALVGFISPIGESHITVSFSVVRPWWTWLLCLIGFLGSAALIGRALKT